MDVLTLSASLCAGIAGTCFLILLFQIIGNVDVDKNAMKEKPRYFPLWFRLLLILEPSVRRLTQSKGFDKARLDAEQNIGAAGMDEVLTVEQYLGLCILSPVMGIVITIILLAGGNGGFGILLGVLLALWPTLWLKATVKKRHLEILKALPNLLDLLTLSVEAGKDFLSALRDILAKRKRDALTDEFSRALHEIQLGKKRQVALREMAERVRQPELMSVV